MSIQTNSARPKVIWPKAVTTKRFARLQRSVVRATDANLALALLGNRKMRGVIRGLTMRGIAPRPDRRSFLASRREKATRRNAEKRGR